MVVFDGRLFVHYCQAYVMSGEAPHPGEDLEACFRGQANGLVGGALRGVLFLTTGLHTGDVGFRVEIHAAEPQPSTVPWDEVVEVSFVPLAEDTELRDWNGTTRCKIPIRPEPHRVRYSANGMDDGRAVDTLLADGDTVDAYQLDFWPAPLAPDAIVRQTSQIAAYWHSERAK